MKVMTTETIRLETLDSGIRDQVAALRECGVEIFESCEGGPGHAYPETTGGCYGEAPDC